MISIGSGRSVGTSPGFGSQGFPRTLCSSLLAYRCSSGTHLTDCTTYVPVSSMTMRSAVFHSDTHKHTPRPTRFQLVSRASVEINALTKARHLNSPRFVFQTHVGSVTVVRLLNQPGKQWASEFQSDSRPLFQEVLECLRKLVRRLNRTLDLSIALALVLWRGFPHNFTVPTALDGVTKSNNAPLLIQLEDDSLVHHKNQGRPSEPLLDTIFQKNRYAWCRFYLFFELI